MAGIEHVLNVCAGVSPPSLSRSVLTPPPPPSVFSSTHSAIVRLLSWWSGCRPAHRPRRSLSQPPVLSLTLSPCRPILIPVPIPIPIPRVALAPTSSECPRTKSTAFLRPRTPN
ncbi:unnamed protein product [Musa acuminata var. zebrina]